MKQSLSGLRWRRNWDEVTGVSRVDYGGYVEEAMPKKAAGNSYGERTPCDAMLANTW